MEIRSYPVFLFLGLTFGIIAATQAGIAAGLPPVRLYVSLLLLSVPALVGSRLMYVFSHLEHYRKHPGRIWATSSGGAALYGGLILALAVSWPLLRLTDLSFGAFWDAGSIALLVGMVFTRIGCLLHGCCAGRATSSWLGVNLPNDSGVSRKRFPTQLLECILAAGLLLGVLSWTNRPFDGAAFLGVVAIYSAARLALGPTREKLDGAAGMNTYNAVSVLLLIASATAFAANIR